MRKPITALKVKAAIEQYAAQTGRAPSTVCNRVFKDSNFLTSLERRDLKTAKNWETLQAYMKENPPPSK